MQYTSMASTFNEIVDCRMVQLEIDYFSLSQIQLQELAQYLAMCCSQIFSESFYCHWNWYGRRINKSLLHERIASASSTFDFSCTADVFSSVVSDSKSFRAYDSMLFSSNSSQLWKESTISYDYAEVLNEYLHDLNDLDKSKEATLKLFHEPGRIKRALWRDHDASAFFSSYKHANHNLFRGSFVFRIALQCLANATTFTKQLTDIAVKTTSITHNINARIALSPIPSPAPCSAHMMYFGGIVGGDKTHIKAGFCPEEWYPYYYFQGAEWFNLLSPMIASRLPKPALGAQMYNQVYLESLPSGVLLVQSAKSIEETDVIDLCDIRKILYPVLFPGKSKILFCNLNNPTAYGHLAKPRQQWECIPIFPEELSIDQNAIYFQYAL